MRVLVKFPAPLPLKPSFWMEQMDLMGGTIASPTGRLRIGVVSLTYHRPKQELIQGANVPLLCVWQTIYGIV